MKTPTQNGAALAPTTDTASFGLAQMLSVTTGRCCCAMEGVYAILNHITGSDVAECALRRAFRYAAPLLLKDHPELQPANACLASLDRWIEADKTERKTECIKMWLAELKMMFPEMDKQFEVRSYADSWLAMDPLAELEGMRKPGQEVVVVNPPLNTP